MFGCASFHSFAIVIPEATAVRNAINPANNRARRPKVILLPSFRSAGWCWPGNTTGFDRDFTAVWVVTRPLERDTICLSCSAPQRCRNGRLDFAAGNPQDTGAHVACPQTA